MLIDATHAEETRVVVLDGNRLEDFDVETAAKKQLKGNIYLAKVVRVEPSLQAAFVEYGGGRHGFLAFGEIHPDYYQIPVADRQRLLELQEAEARAEEEAEDAAAEAAEAASRSHPMPADEPAEATWEAAPIEAGAEAEPPLPLEEAPQSSQDALAQDFAAAREDAVAEDLAAGQAMDVGPDSAPEMAEPATPDAAPDSLTASPSLDMVEMPPPPETLEGAALEDGAPEAAGDGRDDEQDDDEQDDSHHDGSQHDESQHNIAREDGRGSEDTNGEERPESRMPSRFMRSYKIQEVIRRRQILLVQVVKEERGSKGAALTTFISLAGRFSVLMPNSPRGGGISRKITSAADRRRLKEVTTELQIPRGMGLIVRTAGAARPKAEIKRDCEYLLDLWDSIRETTMASSAPALIHEEANLIRRAIRDNYSRDVDEVLVDGEQGWRAARDFMRMLMPAHARKVMLWNEPQPLFARQNVEAQLDAMLSPTVQLRSGGYLVINQTEALVAIDVNSGRSTRERGIEETALKTNLEAADEVARQLRLRDLAGLIVIDFIDMESRRNNAAVEKRMKDALKDDRARIQIGAISSFGLMELSRQRLRPSLAETSFTVCPHCGGTGHVRTTETAALAVLRQVEEEGAKRRAAAIVVYVAGPVALYILNHKRVRLAEIEARYGMSVAFAADDSLLPPETRIDRVRAQIAGEPLPAAIPLPIAATPAEDDLAEEADDEPEDEEDTAEAPEQAVAGETAEEADTRRRKRRRRRRGGRRDEPATGQANTDKAAAEDPAHAEQPDLALGYSDAAPVAAEAVAGEAIAAVAAAPEGAEIGGDEDARARRRGRRGGRRRRREPREGDVSADDANADDQIASFDAAPAPAPAYVGPTPADPFGGHVFDIFDMMDEPEVVVLPPTATPQPPPPAANMPEAESEAAEASRPAEPPEVVPEPVAVADDPVADDPVAEPQAEPLAAAPGEPGLVNGHAAAAAQEAEPEPARSLVPPPVLVGITDTGGEKKRGWWRR
jgi:ribonuclease E